MKLLITGAWNYTEAQLAEIRHLGHDVILMQDENGMLPCHYDSVEGVICNALFLHHSIDRFENLKYIQLTSAGTDRVPMDYITKKGIQIHTARGVYSIPMAEFSLSAVLSIYKQAEHFCSAQGSHFWDKHRGLRELYGKKVCIVGCGSVGNECAKRFAAMGCDVLGVATQARECEFYTEILPVKLLLSAVRASDIVILALPLTKQTYHLMDGVILSSLKNEAILINLSRGGIVDTEALLDVLDQRHDLTAVLDVFETEPLPSEHPLWSMPNVKITPHNSFVGEGNAARLWTLIRENLVSYS